MIVNDLDELLGKLNSLADAGGYLFRGSTNATAKYELVPGAFRDKEMKQYADQFPHSRGIVQEWVDRAIKNVRACPNKALAATDIRILRRLGNLLIVKLQYNYALYQGYRLGNFPKDINDKKLLEIFREGGTLGSGGSFFELF